MDPVLGQVRHIAYLNLLTYLSITHTNTHMRIHINNYMHMHIHTLILIPISYIALLLALLSTLCDTPVSSALCVTGEVTLRGAVLAVGGIKEKVMAAVRGNLRFVLELYLRIYLHHTHTYTYPHPCTYTNTH
ncbi:hypothetical protein EON63_23935 [archaeon]|nr:MAG: hypothetical protein EON63_23935 [archaeon]